MGAPSAFLLSCFITKLIQYDNGKKVLLHLDNNPELSFTFIDHSQHSCIEDIVLLLLQASDKSYERLAVVVEDTPISPLSSDTEASKDGRPPTLFKKQVSARGLRHSDLLNKASCVNLKDATDTKEVYKIDTGIISVYNLQDAKPFSESDEDDIDDAGKGEEVAKPSPVHGADNAAMFKSDGKPRPQLLLPHLPLLDHYSLVDSPARQLRSLSSPSSPSSPSTTDRRIPSQADKINSRAKEEAMQEEKRQQRLPKWLRGRNFVHYIIEKFGTDNDSDLLSGYCSIISSIAIHAIYDKKSLYSHIWSDVIMSRKLLSRIFSAGTKCLRRGTYCPLIHPFPL